MYFQPLHLSDALAVLASHSPQILAGGTDFYPGKVGLMVDENILDVTRIQELQGIAEETNHIRIGAATTWSDMIEAPLPAYFQGLKLAAREIGGAQIQNAGTVTGNLCNASPAADGVPALMSMNASVEIASIAGVRSVPVEEFIVGNRRTQLKRGELVSAIVVPKISGRAHSTFQKLGVRRYLVISIVMVSALVVMGDDGLIRDARIAVGACSPVAVRMRTLEQELIGRPVRMASRSVIAEHFDVLSAIDDIRASRAYRSEMAIELVRCALDEVAA
jgi:CO/xanthine dehydrogenase FAD-binding subunit